MGAAASGTFPIAGGRLPILNISFVDFKRPLGGSLRIDSQEEIENSSTQRLRSG
jgi:hypothetical protein